MSDVVAAKRILPARARFDAAMTLISDDLPAPLGADDGDDLAARNGDRYSGQRCASP